jgi:transposase
MRKHHVLGRRLLTREDDYLRYITDPRIPFDNNAAERGNSHVKAPGQGIGLHAEHRGR